MWCEGYKGPNLQPCLVTGEIWGSRILVCSGSSQFQSEESHVFSLRPYHEDVNAAKWAKLDRKARDEALQALKDLEQADFPPIWRLAVLATYVQDNLQVNPPPNDEAYLVLAKKCLPCAKDEKPPEFNLFEPDLLAVRGTNSELAGSWSTLIMESLLPLIALGQAAKRRVASWCKALQSAVTGKKLSCVILLAAQKEIMEMIQTVCMLAQEDGEAPSDLSPMTAVYEAKAGNRLKLRQALQQSAFYKAQETHAESVVVGNIVSLARAHRAASSGGQGRI